MRTSREPSLLPPAAAKPKASRSSPMTGIGHPPAFCDFLFLGGGSSSLAVSFVCVNVPFTDINDDKKIDLTFAEIYYNNHYQWGINAEPPIADVQTVALHEAGHGLAHGHFGKI